MNINKIINMNINENLKMIIDVNVNVSILMKSSSKGTQTYSTVNKNSSQRSWTSSMYDKIDTRKYSIK